MYSISSEECQNFCQKHASNFFLQAARNYFLLLQLFISPNGRPTSFLGFFLTMYSTVTNIESNLIDKIRVDTHWFTLQIILDLCIPEKELAKTRCQISFI